MTRAVVELEELTVQRLDELDRLRAPCAGSDILLSSNNGARKHAYVSALLWSAPELLTAARELLELREKYQRLNDAAADLVAEAIGPYDPPQRGSNLEKLYRLVSRP